MTNHRTDVSHIGPRELAGLDALCGSVTDTKVGWGCVSVKCFNKVPQARWLWRHIFIISQFRRLEIGDQDVSRAGSFRGQ